jgi:hypothetical protein
MESTVVREGEVYGVLWRNRVNTKMSYPLMSSEGAIERTRKLHDGDGGRGHEISQS